MSEYALQPNESVLYDGTVTVFGRKGMAHLTLTNLNIVITTSVKKSLFAKAEKDSEVYSIQDIKFYEDKPQVVQKGNDVEVFFLSHKLKFHFESILETSKFQMAAMKLLTGKSVQARGADKVKGAINMINDTLGIDTVDTMKGVFENGVVGTLVGGFGKKRKASTVKTSGGKMIEAIGIASEIVQNTSQQANGTVEASQSAPETMTYDEQLATIKKFKELLDAGIITEEEFAAKKKEILGM